MIQEMKAIHGIILIIQVEWLDLSGRTLGKEPVTVPMDWLVSP